MSFFDVVCWREMAENASASLGKGSRVIVTGRLEQRSWESQEGEKRSKVEVIADEVGPSLRPRAVWRSLSGTVRTQVRLTVQRILEEVIADADAG